MRFSLTFTIDPGETVQEISKALSLGAQKIIEEVKEKAGVDHLWENCIKTIFKGNTVTLFYEDEKTFSDVKINDGEDTIETPQPRRNRRRSEQT